MLIGFNIQLQSMLSINEFKLLPYHASLLIYIYIYIYRGRKGIMADIFITLQETKYIILILDIMIQ